MSRHITATGAFYDCISHGLGGSSARRGFLTTLALRRVRGGHHRHLRLLRPRHVPLPLGVEVNWLVFAFRRAGRQRGLTCFDVNLAATVLGAFPRHQRSSCCPCSPCRWCVHWRRPEGWSLVPSIRSTLFTTCSHGDRAWGTTIGGGRIRRSDRSSRSGHGSGSSPARCGESRRTPRHHPWRLGGGYRDSSTYWVSWLAIGGHQGPTGDRACPGHHDGGGDIFFDRPVSTSAAGRSAHSRSRWMSGSFPAVWPFSGCAARCIYAIGRSRDPMCRTAPPTTRNRTSRGFAQTSPTVIVVFFSTSPAATRTPVSTA